MMHRITLFIILFIVASGISQTRVEINDLIEKTKKQIELKEWDEAEENLNVLIALFPDNADLYFYRGYVREMNLKYHECIEDFTKVIELSPEMHITRTNRGYAYKKIGEFDKAISDYKDELEINPNAYSYEHISRVYYLKKEYKTALEYVNISIDEKPTNSIAYKTRALIYKELGLKEKACQDKSKAIELQLLEKYPSYDTDIRKLDNYCEE